MWVIHKKSRLPTNVSYNGSTWDQAKMRDEYQRQYKDRKQAEILACYLTRQNPIGFEVSQAIPRAKQQQ